MSEQITHYDVLGVEQAADKDAIRTAYQERLGEVRADIERAQGAKKPDESAIDGYRREEARVRSAWQVLSDPYQRGRYDATVELGAADDVSADGEVEVVGDDEAPVDRREARTRQRAAAARNRPPGMFSPEHPPTPSGWPPGFTAPPPRARTLALMIDCFVLLIFFFGANFAAVEVTSSIYPHKTDRIDQLDTLITKTQDQKDKSDSKADNAKTKEAKKPFQAKSKALQKKLDKFQNERDDLDKGIAGTRFGVLGGVFLLLSGLYLIPSTMMSGRTFGKRLLRIRVVMIDGSPVRLSAALKRYGMPLLVTLALFGVLGQLAFAVTLFGVLTWPRNPNLQGLHDRLSGTIVVDG
jgi:curved DNA-binding protein CbpA